LQTTVVDLGATPLANSFIPPDGLYRPEIHYPLHAWVCDGCLMVQVEEFEAPKNIFDDYSYFSSFSDSWLAHCRAYAAEMIASAGLDERSLVVEVASNDGYLLQYFKEAGVGVLGIEPAHTVAEAAIAKGIPTRQMFFNEATARELEAEGMRADLIAAKNVLAHVPDINDFVAGFEVLLKEGGVITVEFPHLLNLIEQFQFDTIYHEHFAYLSLNVVRRIFAAHGLRVFDVKEVPTHGGSLRIFACHEQDAAHPDAANVRAICEREEQAGLEDPETYRGFQQKVVEVKNGLLTFLIECSRKGKSVVGYGAPAKGNTLLNYCGVGPEYLAYTVDRSPHKQGHFLPGSRIPVHHPSRISETRPDFVLILPWNLEREIRETMAHVADWGGRFVTAIPEIKIF
jgi:SAM-dependent methyltransferase